MNPMLVKILSKVDKRCKSSSEDILSAVEGTDLNHSS